MTKASRLDRDGNVITRPAPQAVNDAINQFLWEHLDMDDLANVLAPLGVHPSDVAAPRYEIVDYSDPREQMGRVQGFFYWLFVEGPQERRYWRTEGRRG